MTQKDFDRAADALERMGNLLTQIQKTQQEAAAERPTRMDTLKLNALNTSWNMHYAMNKGQPHERIDLEPILRTADEVYVWLIGD